jgi:hypothetical protein
MTLPPRDSSVVTKASSAANLVLAHNAEKTLVHRIIIGLAIAVPVNIGFWVGLIALAVHSAHPAGAIGMAVGIGFLNGVFFGTWAGFVASNDTFDELDHLADTIADRES